MKKAYVCPKTRPLTVGFEGIMAGSTPPTTSGPATPVMGNDVKGTAASGRMW